MIQALKHELKSWWGDTSSTKAPIGLLASLIVFTFLFRLPDLGSRSLWYDEAFSILFSRTGLLGMLKGTLTPGVSGSADIHPLLYYVLLWVWTSLFGSSVLVVRLLSVFTSLAVLTVLVVMMNQMLSVRAAAIAGFLYALSPFQIQYAQEARMYGLLSLWLLLSAYSIWLGCKSEERWPWIAFGVSAALAMYTHNLAAVFLLPLAFTPFWFHRGDLWRRLLAGIGVAVVIYLPWGVQLPGQLSKVVAGYWIERPFFASLIQTLLGFITGLPLDGVMLVLGLFVSLTILAFLSLLAWQIWRGRGSSSRELAWFASLSIIPVSILFLISQLQPVYIVRGLLPSGVMFLLLSSGVLAASIGKPGLRASLAAALLSSFVLGQIAHHRYDGFPYAPFQAIGEFLEDEVMQGDVILHANKLSMIPQVYYSPALPQTYIGDEPGSGSDTLARPTQEVLGLLAEPNALTAVRDAKRVFFLVFKQELIEYQQAGLPSNPTLTWLQTYYDQVGTMKWGDLQLFLFVRESNQLSCCETSWVAVR